jgi:hypothetical protein
MAQWNKTTQDYLNQERSLFEVFIQADHNGYIFDPLGQGFSGDLFGRLKVSETYTLFDSTHRYSQDGDFDDVVLGAGSTVGIITSQSTATLGIGTTAGCSIIRESKRVFSYQPGKALQVLQTFVMSPPKANLTQRVGYGGSENGVFLEQATNSAGITTVYWMMRTAKSGITTEIRVAQSDWSKDNFTGVGGTTNPSEHNLDLTKAQLMFTEYEWLGVGAVRCGFAHEDGNFHIAHQFEHANILDGVYMTTATLPIRYEILNTGITTSSSTMKQICVSVQSNGGYERLQRRDVARRITTVSVGTTAFTPLVSIRLTPGREDAVILPKAYSFLGSSNSLGILEVAWIRNATLTNAGTITWESLPGTPNAEKNTDATAMSGGVVISNDYVSSSNRSDTPLNIESIYNWDLQLGRTQTKVSDVLTLAVRAVSGSADCIGSISFYDLT